MINRRQLFVLASGAVMFAGARGANAAQLTNAQKRLTLVTDMIVRNEAGVIVSSARSKDVLGAGNRKMAVGSINRNNDGAASLTRAATKNLVTVHRESDDSLPVLAKIEIVVEYSEDGQSIAIRSRKYSIIQTDPLVMYANAWYALMQKDKYVMNYFTESEASYETGWGPTPYDAEKDKWTCGSGMGATITDFINDSTYSFAIDCYIE